MILTKEVEVIPSGKNIKYYKDKGYDAKWREPLVVKIEDLPDGSKSQIEVECDICHKHKKTCYCYYIDSISKYGYYTCCSKCSQEKVKKTNLLLYGKESYTSTEEYRKHCRETCISRYGFDSPCKNKEIKAKQIKTLKERYGVDSPLKNDKIKEKALNTIRVKYGVSWAFQNDEIKTKIENTLLERYGVKNPSQSLIVQEKKIKSFYKNSSQKTSSQQLHLHHLYGGELNYPIKYYSSDICFPEEKLCIEFDGGGHDLSVKLNTLTQEEFDQKEIIRNQVIKREGYKIMRIISSTDKLPSDEILLQMLSQARQYFSDYPNHSWIYFNIDTSTVHNAEHKEGVFFDFGELRKIHSTDEPVAV